MAPEGEADSHSRRNRPHGVQKRSNFSRLVRFHPMQAWHRGQQKLLPDWPRRRKKENSDCWALRAVLKLQYEPSAFSHSRANGIRGVSAIKHHQSMARIQLPRLDERFAIADHVVSHSLLIQPPGGLRCQRIPVLRIYRDAHESSVALGTAGGRLG